MNGLPDNPSYIFAKLCSIAGKTSAEYSLLMPDDRLLAALSGGADSFVLLETLLELKRRAPFKFELTAVTFDPGFENFNCEAISSYCRSRQIEHHVAALDVPNILSEDLRQAGRFRRPCVRCSRLRRGKLYGVARELGVNKLALGHHADDLLESFFISLVRGQGLTTMGPNVPADTRHGDSASLRIIRPLAMVPEAWVKMAAGNFDFPVAGECPYSSELETSGDRAWAKRELAEWSKRIPDIRTLMLKSMGKVELSWLLDKRYLTMDNISGQPEGEKL